MERDEQAAVAHANAWRGRHAHARARADAAGQRALAASGREDAALVRELAAKIRADAALVRDEGARTRDEAARIRDAGARTRDQAAQARDLSNKTREEALRLRVVQRGVDDARWTEVLDLDRLASEHARTAATHDRDAAELDRAAAQKDRDAAERDRTAALRDREAADKDREASDKDRGASDADREAAESDRVAGERVLELAEARLDREERLATLGRIAANLVHEVSSPLAALMMNLGVLREASEAGPLPEGVSDGIADAILATERITRVVTEMRTWIHGGLASAPRQRLDTARLVTETLRLVRKDVERVAQLHVDVQPVDDLYGVPERLSQALTNLLLNAAHAIRGSHDDNEVRITVSSLDAQTVRFEVKDTGVGIAREALDHVFDTFFTTRTAQGGVGLGLGLCQRIALDHGGTLVVESTLGVGSTFRMDLPRGADASAHAPTREPTSTRPRVLVIDDDASFCAGLARFLSDRCDVSIAENGVQGLARLAADGPAWDLVLCDLSVPAMNGLELYAALHAREPAKAAALVFTSEAATPVGGGFLAGLPNVRLQKPFDPARLLALIDERAGTRG